jgi:DNA-directed RNA polymerase specialized sigma24 family protein
LPDLEPDAQGAREAMDAGPRRELAKRIHGSRSPSVRSFLRRALRSGQDADDLTQGTCLRAPRSAGLEDRHDRGAGLLPIARIPPRDHFRREQIVSFRAADSLDGRDLTDPPRHPEDLTHARREPRSPSQTLVAPPERARPAVTLHEAFPLSCCEAAVTESPSRAVRRPIASGLATCRAAFRGGAAGPGTEARRRLPFRARRPGAGNASGGRT